MDVVQGIMKTVGNPATYFNVKIIHINIGYYLSVLLLGMVEKFCNNILKKDRFISKNKIDFLAIDQSTSGEKAKNC